jgi:ABC-2 type transport system permease protein
VISLGNLYRNELMKIMDRTRTIVMLGLLILVVFLLALGQRWILVAGAPVDLWEFAAGCTHLLFIVQLFTLVVAGDIISSEFGWGTVKLLLIRPVSRTKILLSKFAAVITFLLLAMAVLLIASLLFGAIFFRWTPESGKALSALKHLGTIYGLYGVEVIVMASLALMLSAAFRSSTLSVGLSVFLFFAGAFLTEMLKAWGGGSWGKYLLFANLDLTPFFLGYDPPFPGMTLGHSLTVIAVHWILFYLIAWWTFAKRDVQ